jgi:hypothetical protein
MLRVQLGACAMGARKLRQPKGPRPDRPERPAERSRLAAASRPVSAAMQHGGGAPGADGRVTVTGTCRKQFFSKNFFEIFFEKIAKSARIN